MAWTDRLVGCHPPGATPCPRIHVTAPWPNLRFFVEPRAPRCDIHNRSDGFLLHLARKVLPRPAPRRRRSRRQKCSDNQDRRGRRPGDTPDRRLTVGRLVQRFTRVPAPGAPGREPFQV